MGTATGTANAYVTFACATTTKTTESAVPTLAQLFETDGRRAGRLAWPEAWLALRDGRVRRRETVGAAGVALAYFRHLH
jgi:hypothetical protein